MRKRDEEVFRRAVELAASGKCKGWYDIQGTAIAVRQTS